VKGGVVCVCARVRAKERARGARACGVRAACAVRARARACLRMQHKPENKPKIVSPNPGTPGGSGSNATQRRWGWRAEGDTRPAPCVLMSM
jgi:hypothetical protein